MPRDLADVLHYFLPEIEDESKPDGGPLASEGSGFRDPVPESPVADEDQGRELPILGVPIGDRDVVRAALTWNLAVEIARLGRTSIVLAPSSKAQTPLWPARGVGALGTEMCFCPAENLKDLEAAAAERSKASAASGARDPGALFVHVPPEWLARDELPPRPISWWLLLSSPDHGNLSSSRRIAAAIRKATPSATIGVTIHGVSSIHEAQQAYEHLSRRCGEELGLELRSYGLLVDDLHVYRAIAAQRPIGLEHPQAPATRALMDVARLLSADAGSVSLG